MEELKRHKLRTDYGNKTGDKIRTEHYVSFNHDYVKYLEDELLKLLNIGVVSGAFSYEDMKRCAEFWHGSTIEKKYFNEYLNDR